MKRIAKNMKAVSWTRFLQWTLGNKRAESRKIGPYCPPKLPIKTQD